MVQVAFSEKGQSVCSMPPYLECPRKGNVTCPHNSKKNSTQFIFIFY